MLELHRERLIARMPLLAEKFSFKIPKRIVLRPLYVKGLWSVTAGRYWWEPGKGFSIAVNPIYCLSAKDKGLWVIDHEMSHIAAGIRFDEWQHGPEFKTIYKFCRTGRKLRPLPTAGAGATPPRAAKACSSMKSAESPRRRHPFLFR